MNTVLELFPYLKSWLIVDFFSLFSLVFGQVYLQRMKVTTKVGRERLKVKACKKGLQTIDLLQSASPLKQ